MKVKILLLITLFSIGVSCSNWLDVQPKTAIKGEKLFNSEAGFIDALTGFYIKMGATSLYGKELSYGLVDFLACNYDNYPNYKGIGDKQKYDYQGVWRGTTDGIFSSLYNTIANINEFLNYIDSKGEHIKTKNYKEIMKGEALGLRAFLHFELYKLYGPVYTANDERKVLVYSDRFDKEKRERLTSDAFLEKVEKDLLNAEAILKEVDPLIFGIPSTSSSSFNSFTYQRQLRFNLYAVEATLAHLYSMYPDAAHRQKAVEYAKAVIESNQFPLVVNKTGYIYYQECIFALHIYELDKVLTTNFNTDVVDGNPSVANHIYITADNFKTLYEFSKGGATDLRATSKAFKDVIDGNKVFKYCLKYRQDVYTNQYNGKEIMPLIRIPEMYYIIAECSSDKAESADALNTMRWTRGIPNEDEIIPDEKYDNKDERVGYSSDHSVRINEIMKEYQKEFFAEGKLFSFYKKYNYKTFFRCPVDNMSAYYQLPVPDDEIIFGKN